MYKPEVSSIRNAYEKEMDRLTELAVKWGLFPELISHRTFHIIFLICPVSYWSA